MIRRAWVMLLVVWMAQAPGPSFAATAHLQLEVAPDKVFQRLLEAAQARQAEQAAKALVLLNPVLDEIDQAFGTHLTQDLAAALDDPGLERAVQRALAYSVILLLRDARRGDDPGAVAPSVRLAFSEYLVLDPDMQRRDVEQSKAMKLAFRRANAAAGARPGEFLAACEEIERTLLAAYALPAPGDGA